MKRLDEMSKARRSLIGLIDQALYSAVNFGLTVFVARASTANQFGVYSLAFAAYLICSAINRGISSEPLIVAYSARDQFTTSCAAADWRRIPAFFGALAGLCAMTVGIIALSGESRWLLIVLGACAPVTFAQDYLRYAALAVGKPTIAFLSDMSVFCLQLVGTLLIIVLGREQTSWLFVACWGIATAVGFVVASVALKLHSDRSTRARVPLNWFLARRFGLDNFMTQIAQQGTSYVVAGITGLAAAAGLRAAQTVFTPPAILSLGLQTAVTPELVRVRSSSLHRMRHFAGFVALSLAACGLAYLAVIQILPARFGSALFGPSWFRAQSLILFIGLSQVAGAFTNAAVAGLRGLGAANQTLRARGAALCLSIALVIPLSIVLGAKGAAIGLFIATSLQACVWWIAFGVELRGAKLEEGRQLDRERWNLLMSTRPTGGDAPPGDMSPSLARAFGYAEAWARATDSPTPTVPRHAAESRGRFHEDHT